MFPEVEYTFKHALTHEVALGSLLYERRRELHRRTLLALKAHGTVKDSSGLAERLAHHAEQAECWEDAMTYFRQCGQTAASRSPFREAARHFEQAVRAIEHLPEGRSRDELAVDTRLQSRLPLWHLGRYDDVLRLLREAEAVASVLGDPRHLAWIRVQTFNLLWLLGRPAEEWRALLDDVRTAMEMSDDVTLQVIATNQFAQACWNMGDYRTEARLLEMRLPIADAATGTPATAGQSVTFRSLLAGVNAQMGDFVEAERHGCDAVQ